jgi:hypothetical protein
VRKTLQIGCLFSMMFQRYLGDATNNYARRFLKGHGVAAAGLDPACPRAMASLLLIGCTQVEAYSTMIAEKYICR